MSITDYFFEKFFQKLLTKADSIIIIITELINKMIISKKGVICMKEKNSIVVFGGSFNPPLNSHFLMAQEVLNQYEEVEKIIFVPVNKKYPKDGLVENEHRYNMLKLVADKNSDFIISDLDLHGKRSLYTIEVLEEIQRQFKDKEVRLLIGSDNLKELHTWNSAEELISKYKVLVMVRDQDEIQEIIIKDNLLNCYKENIEEINPAIRGTISSTYVRAQIKKGKSVKYLLPDEVLEYIEKNNLYKF